MRDHVVGDEDGRSSSRARSQQSGFSLIETLVALALISIAFFGVAAGVLTAMSASRDTHSRRESDTALIAVTEAMKSAPYSACATPAALQAAWNGTSHLADGRAYTVTISKVSYWNPASGHQTFETGACPVSGASKDAGSQMIGLTVHLAGSSTGGSVVVRDPSATP